MEDSQIIDLYWQREEAAIAETQRKYGAFCYGVAKNILSVHEDAEECVSDTWQRAWESIPPQRPVKLRAWLGKIVRNLALNLWNKNHTQKRYVGMTELFSELEDCIPSPETVEREIEEKELSEYISAWLLTLSREDRILFVRRYWNGIALRDLAKEWNLAPDQLAQRMYRLRGRLKTALEKEGISL